MRAVIHVHTWHSPDSLTPPAKLVDLAVNEKIDVLCITDHHTVDGALEAKKYALKKYGGKIEVVPGIEFSSEKGDIIGLGICRNFSSRNPEDIIHFIKNEGGLVLLPHPFAGHTNVEWLARRADVIEVFNARVSAARNEQAALLAENLKKPVYAGSDAHTLGEMMLCVNTFEGNGGDFFKKLLSAGRTFSPGYSTRNQLLFSKGVKGWKTKNWRLMAWCVKQWLSQRRDNACRYIFRNWLPMLS